MLYKSRLPVKVVFIQQFVSRYEALVAERKIKQWTRKKKEALIKGSWDEIALLSKRKTSFKK